MACLLCEGTSGAAMDIAHSQVRMVSALHGVPEPLIPRLACYGGGGVLHRSSPPKPPGLWENTSACKSFLSGFPWPASSHYSLRCLAPSPLDIGASPIPFGHQKGKGRELRI